MVMTVINVATPIVSPSMVSEARILWARKALTHWARLSRTASMMRKGVRLLGYQIRVARVDSRLIPTLFIEQQYFQRSVILSAAPPQPVLVESERRGVEEPR